MSFLNSMSEQRERLRQKPIQDRLNHMEEDALHKEARDMSEMLDYQLTKGEIDAKTHTKQAIEIQRQYKDIVRRIYK